MIAISSALFSCAALVLLWAVGSVISLDQRRTENQVAYIGGKPSTVNREGCAEVSLVCAFNSVAGGRGGGDCDRFYQLTGETVPDWCCKNYKEGCHGSKSSKRR